MRKMLMTAVLLVACDRPDPDAGKQRPDTPEGRRKMVEIISKDMPANSMWTEGARSEGLVVSLQGCTSRTLSEFVQGKDIASRLQQFDFAYVKCENGTRVDGPWAK